MSKLRLAVVGAGHLGRVHARLAAQMPDVELVAVVDPIPAARQQVASDHACQAFASHEEVLDRVDAAVIATPTRFHHAVALDFLSRGVPLLVEKPLASSLAEADEIVSLAERGHTLLQVGHIERFNPAFLAVAPRVGEPKYVEAVRASGFTGRSTDIGVVHDLMIHDIDLLLAMVDSPLRSVQALGIAILGPKEDAAQARLEFECGCVANLSASRISFDVAPTRHMRIWSAQGFAAVDFANRSAKFVRPSASIVDRTVNIEALDAAERASLKQRVFGELLSIESLEIAESNALADELRDFVDCIRDARAPRVSGRQGQDALAVAEAVLRSIESHAWDGRKSTAMGPLAVPTRTILRGPHWRPAPAPRDLREAG